MGETREERIAWLRDQQAKGTLIERRRTMMTIPRLKAVLEREGVCSTAELAEGLGVTLRSFHTWSQGESKAEMFERNGIKRGRGADRRTNIWYLAEALGGGDELDLSDFSEEPAEEVLEEAFGEVEVEEEEAPPDQPFAPHSPWAALNTNGA